MKIGLLYICTGEYDVFWKDFYQSCELNFLKDHEKHYFVFTDSLDIFDSNNNRRIHLFSQKNLGRPYNTLMRFHIFLSQIHELKKMDYLFFFNANLEFKKQIGNEILPTEMEGLSICQHPGFYNKPNTKFTYEKNPQSTAYISDGEGNIYVAGGLNGGKTKIFLGMCKVLAKNIDKDLSNGIIAIWHDESHLNHYILSHHYKLLDPSYLYPEGWDIPFDCKILIRDKSKKINVDKVKGIKKNFFKKIFNIGIKIGKLFKK